MPFTFSHPALVLPLALLPRRWVSLTGLVAGASVPDFDYFIWLKIQSRYGHTWPGIFYFDVPVGLLLAFVFHAVVRNALVANSPAFIQQRFGHLYGFNWPAHFARHWLAVVGSVAVGAASHLLWDSFTHLNGALVQAMPALQQAVLVGSYPWPLYNILQHSSTLVGAVAILLVVLAMPRQTRVVQKPRWWFWATIALLAMAFTAYRITTIRYYQIDNLIIVIGMSGSLLGLVVASVLFRFMKQG